MFLLCSQDAKYPAKSKHEGEHECYEGLLCNLLQSGCFFLFVFAKEQGDYDDNQHDGVEDVDNSKWGNDPEVEGPATRKTSVEKKSCVLNKKQNKQKQKQNATHCTCH